MSIPSSSEEVATRQGSLPDLSSSSTTNRSSWASEPWWALAISIGFSSARTGSELPACSVAGSSSGGLVVGELVEALGEALGAAAVVDEDDRRGVLLHQPQQLGVDRGPDRAGVRGRVEGGLDRTWIDPVGRRFGRGSCRRAPPPRPRHPPAGARWGPPLGATRRRSVCGRRAGLGHVLDRDDYFEVELLAAAGVDDLALAAGTDEEGGDAIERSLRRREADPLRVGATLGGDQVREALEGQRQVGAALRLGDGVDLVDDHRLGAGEHLARR